MFIKISVKIDKHLYFNPLVSASLRISNYGPDVPSLPTAATRELTSGTCGLSFELSTPMTLPAPGARAGNSFNLSVNNHSDSVPVLPDCTEAVDLDVTLRMRNTYI